MHVSEVQNLGHCTDMKLTIRIRIESKFSSSMPMIPGPNPDQLLTLQN